MKLEGILVSGKSPSECTGTSACNRFSGVHPPKCSICASYLCVAK